MVKLLQISTPVLIAPMVTFMKWLVRGECLRVHVAIDGIAAEHAAEEHDFGHQEHPHAERGGFQLLCAVVEMVLQLRRVRRQNAFRYPPISTSFSWPE